VYGLLRLRATGNSGTTDGIVLTIGTIRRPGPWSGSGLDRFGSETETVYLICC